MYVLFLRWPTVVSETVVAEDRTASNWLAPSPHPMHTCSLSLCATLSSSPLTDAVLPPIPAGPCEARNQ